MFRNELEIDLAINDDNDDISFEHGSIVFSEDGKTANIIFFDHPDTWKAHLKIYSLLQLKKLPSFKYADKIEGSEILINTWFTKRSGNTLFKFSENTQLGFIFNSEGKLIDDLKKIQSLNFDQITYFREREFGDFLYQHLRVTIHDLRIMGMDEKRLQLFCNHLPGLLNLINRGASKEQLLLSDFSNIETCLTLSNKNLADLLAYFTLSEIFTIEGGCLLPILNNLSNLKILLKSGLTAEHLKNKNLPILEKCLRTRQLNDVLHFVTIGQIFKLDPTPIPLENLLKNPTIQASSYIAHFGSGTVNEFQFNYNETNIQITCLNSKEKQSYFNLTLLKFDETTVTWLSHKIGSNKSQLFSLIHDWYLIEDKVEESDNINYIIHSPELKYIIRQTYSFDFPIDKLKYDTPLLLICPYYEEIALAHFLKQQGYAIESLRKMQGMSTKKLELLCQHQDVVLDLMRHNMCIEDLAIVDEKRLQYIMLHYDKAKYALAFVSARECLGLTTTVNESLLTHSLFKSDQSFAPNEMTNNPYSNFCVIS